MNQEPVFILRDLIAQYGFDLCSDVRRCEALLKDFCPQHETEIFLLTCAVRQRIHADLLSSRGREPFNLTLKKLTHRLASQLSISEIGARWAVESMAVALSVVSENEIHTLRREPIDKNRGGKRYIYAGVMIILAGACLLLWYLKARSNHSLSDSEKDGSAEVVRHHSPADTVVEPDEEARQANDSGVGPPSDSAEQDSSSIKADRRPEKRIESKRNPSSNAEPHLVDDEGVLSASQASQGVSGSLQDETVIVTDAPMDPRPARQKAGLRDLVLNPKIVDMLPAREFVVRVFVSASGKVDDVEVVGLEPGKASSFLEARIRDLVERGDWESGYNEFGDPVPDIVHISVRIKK